MLACIVLNYNDCGTTFQLLNKIENYKVLDKIIVVDGASTDDSYLQLKKRENSKIMVVLANKNGGYGYGNNVGIRKAKQLGFPYALIANPDVDFEEAAIEDTLQCITENSKCVAAAPRMHGREPAMKIASPVLDATFSCMFLNKLLRPRYYPKEYYQNKEWCYVDALPGSLVMFDVEKFISCGLYDEKVFLYHEEIMVGKKFQQAGFQSTLLLKDEYMHYHSVSVRKAYKSVVKSKKMTMNSHKYYLKNYCDSPLAVVLLTVLRPIAYLESYLWGILKRQS